MLVLRCFYVFLHFVLLFLSSSSHSRQRRWPRFCSSVESQPALTASYGRTQTHIRTYTSTAAAMAATASSTASATTPIGYNPLPSMVSTILCSSWAPVFEDRLPGKGERGEKLLLLLLVPLDPSDRRTFSPRIALCDRCGNVGDRATE